MKNVIVCYVFCSHLLISNVHQFSEISYTLNEMLKLHRAYIKFQNQCRNFDAIRFENLSCNSLPFARIYYSDHSTRFDAIQIKFFFGLKDASLDHTREFTTPKTNRDAFCVNLREIVAGNLHIQF